MPPQLKSWTGKMNDLFDFQVEAWQPITGLIYNGQTPIDYIKKPISAKFAMMPNNYSKQADTTFDVRRADAVTVGLYAVLLASPRPSITALDADGRIYQILDYSDDDTANPIIQLHAKERQ